jgi:hypothetical protein
MFAEDNVVATRTAQDRRGIEKAKDELSPKAIADLTGMKAVNVRVLLGKMMANGEIS